MTCNKKHGETVQIIIDRFDPSIDEVHSQKFVIPIIEDMTILDALFFIKENFDNSLAFRASCENGVCGSCAIKINGTNKLACESFIIDNIKPDNSIWISPMDNFPIIRDLIIENEMVWKNYEYVMPWINSPNPPSNSESIVSPDLIYPVNNIEKCISCSICVASCPIMEHENNFVGPHAIIQAYQKMFDSRENTPLSRINQLNSIWQCTTCLTCNLMCPLEIEPGNACILIRNKLIENFMLPKTLGKALSSIYENNNPYGVDKNKRYEWATLLDFPNAISDPVDYCIINCCISCYDPAILTHVKYLTSFLLANNINIGFIGNLEQCCGSEVYRLGEFGLFNYIKEKQFKLIKSIKSNTIVCSSPHCFDTYKNKFPFFEKQILHISEFIAQLIKSQSISFSKKISKKVTFHDPCYLGKQNHIYDEPRYILQNIPGIDFVEMEHIKENSICCGGGGGNTWNNQLGGEMADRRIKEALKTGADYLVTCCPFCYIEFDNAIKRLPSETKLRIISMEELFLEATKP